MLFAICLLLYCCCSIEKGILLDNMSTGGQSLIIKCNFRNTIFCMWIIFLVTTELFGPARRDRGGGAGGGELFFSIHFEFWILSYNLFCLSLYYLYYFLEEFDLYVLCWSRNRQCSEMNQTKSFIYWFFFNCHNQKKIYRVL